MSDELLLWLALAVTTLGMTCFALSIQAHWRELFGERAQPQGQRIALRVSGAALVGGAFFICAAADPIMMAMLVWPMLLMVGAAIVAAGFTIHAQSRRAPKKSRG